VGFQSDQAGQPGDRAACVDDDDEPGGSMEDKGGDDGAVDERRLEQIDHATGAGRAHRLELVLQREGVGEVVVPDQP
jgi:hypothetical protein